MEKPFASLVNDAETTDQLPSERALTETNLTAYLDLKDEGLQEDGDWDQTLLDDGDDEASDDDPDEHDAFVGGQIFQEEEDAEQDPLSAAPGATSVTTLRATAQSCQRGLVVKKVDSSNNFEVYFDISLRRKTKDRRGVAHFAIGGVVGSQIPRICVAPNSTRLVFYLRHGNFRAKVSTKEIPLSKMVRVRFRLSQNMVSIDIDGKVEATMFAEGLQVPVPAKLFAYLSGPGDKAADAVVGGAVYRWRHFALRPRVQATTIFELPPDEIQLMRTVTNELMKARRLASVSNKWQFVSR